MDGRNHLQFEFRVRAETEQGKQGSHIQLLRDNLSLWNPQDPADRNARLDPADRSPLKDNP